MTDITPSDSSGYDDTDWERDDIKNDAKRRPASFLFQPTEFAPRYAELNPDGRTDIVHVITTLEAPSR